MTEWERFAEAVRDLVRALWEPIRPYVERACDAIARWLP